MSNIDLTTEQQKTFENLQKPTMSLIGSFYEMPSELKGVFASMMAIYEAEPSKQTAQKISNLVMGREAYSVKKARIMGYAAKVPAKIRAAAKKKYIDEKQSAPAGMPTSGMFMVGMGVISNAEKEALMDAQAACRLLELTSNPQKSNAQANAVPANCKLTKMQHLERIVRGFVDIAFEQSRVYVQELNGLFHNHDHSDKFIDFRGMAYLFLSEDAFVHKANAQALKTLKESASKIKNPQVSAQIKSLSGALTSEILEIKAQDYKDLMTNVAGFKGAEVIIHHSKQILEMEKQIQLSNEKSR